MDSSAWTKWFSQDPSILLNIAKTTGPLQQLVTGAAYLVGLFFIFKALHSLKAYGESKTAMSSGSSMKEPVVYFLVGALLIYLPTAFNTFLFTIFGYNSPLAYAPMGSNNEAVNALFGPDSTIGKPLADIIQFIGVVAFVRGWILLARSASQGNQPGSTGKGFTHVVGGVLAMNIVGTMQVVNNTIFGS